MVISIIVAMANNGVIGNEGKMPWHLPADLRNFRSKTINKAIVMGRKTYESLGKALPNRVNIVVSRNPELKLPDALVFNDLEEVLDFDYDEIFVIGGAEIYKQAMPYAKWLYLTRVDCQVDGDTHFEYNKEDWKWVMSESYPADDKNKYGMSFELYRRKWLT